ncbi:protein SERAC1-like [Anoplophora glabripennis]|uniref:protein SERAC1-like n=1 Tax=Anoplophora glabripennis TaxID=217634 RepID=UPI000873CC09|nr:protein SERAC1-like [Anoplophora glabripennis]
MIPKNLILLVYFHSSRPALKYGLFPCCHPVYFSAFQNEDPNVKNVCLNTKGIVFYSTPHFGSRIANLSQATALLLWPSVEVQELRQNSPQLKMIHENFLDIVKSLPVKIVTFVETKATVVTAMKFNFLLVEPESGHPGVGEYFEVPQDHLGICKPAIRYSFLYQKVVSMIRQILKELEPPDDEQKFS